MIFQMNIFLTGGTGFIGKHLLQALSAQNHHIYVLVRSLKRFEHIMKQIELNDNENITPVLGDLTQIRLGLHESNYQQILNSDTIIHAGGPMNITLKPEEADDVFLRPAREIANIAKEIHAVKGLRHFIHVVGFMSPYNEHNATKNLSAHLENAPPYEKMKFEADSFIRKALMQLNIPLSTVNPSVVIGDSYSGTTEQIGGLSILVDSVRRNLMPLVPGGKNYWLPMVHIDHVAAFISNLVDIEVTVNNTYYLLDQKQDSLSVKTLVNMIAKETRVSLPNGTVPLPLLKSVLRLGAGKLLGIPAESMNFLVKSEFPSEAKDEIEQKSGVHTSILPSTIPFVISDLDFRLSHSEADDQNNFSRRRRANLITLERNAKEKDTEGIPVIILHGTFSGANCFLPMAQAMTDANVWLVDLPGFGRTPYHHQSSIVQGYVDSLAEMILNLNTPVILVGHSFGGLIAAKVMEKVDHNIKQLILLQPVLHTLDNLYRYSFVTEIVLKHSTKLKLKKMMLKNNDFIAEDERFDVYVDYIFNDLKSPRVRKTTAEVMSSLTQSKSIQLQPHKWKPDKVKILWGDQDNQHHIPKQYEHIDSTHIPFGHQFPISEPEITANWITQILS
jgi:thioester reductase-like protein/pimeloyl-ACP methyl ester carboxylesterase